MHKSGGGATRFKQHLAGKGTEVVHCRNVPLPVREYFQREIERTKKATFERNKERLRKEAVAAEGNYPDAEDEEEVQLQHAILLSRAED
jgi:hypothetical protein